MQRIFRIFDREFASVNQAALLLGFFTLLSQILALFRDRLIAHFIGPSVQLDAYYAAFRIPDLIFISIASLFSITVLIPFLVEKMAEGKITPETQRFLNNIFSVFLLAMILISIGFFFLMPCLINLIAPGFDPDLQLKTITLSRIMLLSPILLGLSNLFGTVTQLFKKFFLYSLSPALYNLGIILGILFLSPFFDVYGLAVGVVLGALLHFSIQAIGSRRCGLIPKFTFSLNLKEIWRVILISLPRTMGLAFNSFALIWIVALASFLKSGSISIFNFSYNLQTVPLNIIGISYAVAAFPTLVKSFSGGRLDEFKNHLRTAGRQIIFWSLPITFLFIVLRAQIVRVILGSGSFSWNDTRLVAASLAIFSVSVLAQGMVGLLSRTYYAKGETRRPLLLNFLSSILIVFLSYLFIQLFEHFAFFRYFFESILRVSGIGGTEVLMLPLAYSVGSLVNFILHWLSVKKDFMRKEPFITRTFFQSLGASFFIGLVSFLSLQALSPIFGTSTFWGVFSQGLLSGLLGILAGLVVLYLLKNEELRDLLKILRTKFWGGRVIIPSQEEL
jgi:putative peptidoglycan lipid II flippase